MQTFLPYADPVLTAKILDNKRLGKQRIETIQIARNLLQVTEKKGWSNHPAVRMWRGYEAYLIKVYLLAILNEWVSRGFNNEKCSEHYSQLVKLVGAPQRPHWFSDSFFRSHQSNLLRKNAGHYSQYFVGVPDDLDYIWPVPLR
jgi:hypothetical protein